jgi:NAD(P)-dependent dehydrogenase (short-subunit alcohol dehydrogenase family)
MNVVVAISGLDFGPLLADALAAHGMATALIGDEDTAGFASRAHVEAAFMTAAEKLGSVNLVIHAAAVPRIMALADMSSADFHDKADAPLRATLRVLQSAHRHMAARGGAIVVLGPALSLVGASQLVPLTTACESQRSLVKAAARQWGAAGIRVNWVGIADHVFAPALEGLAPQVPELGPPPCALGQAPDLANDIAPVLAFLGSAAGRALTGASLNLDGGGWMTP